MFIRIERDSAVPISGQIANQIRALCLSGSLSPGARLPSVRQLARELTVNQNTVLHVYERLTAENLLEMRHGDGTYVSQDLPTWRLKGQQQRFADEFQRLVREARLLGFEGPQLHALLDEGLEHFDRQSLEERTGGEVTE